MQNSLFETAQEVWQRQRDDGAASVSPSVSQGRS
jgi:hypothetical protein